MTPFELALYNELKLLVTEDRLSLLNQKADNRTDKICIVLEDIFQRRNISACLRSADCFGIQDVHIIENRNEYADDIEVSVGAEKWLSINRYNSKRNNTDEVLSLLKRDGYTLLATSPDSSNMSLTDLDVSEGKFALIFGTEKDGLTKTALKNSDLIINIPTYGFTESFNVSVAAALCLQHLSYKLRLSRDDCNLNKIKRDRLLLDWLCKSVKSSEYIINKLEEEFYKK